MARVTRAQGRLRAPGRRPRRSGRGVNADQARKERDVQAPKKIAVAGATGRVGRHVVDALEARGHDVVRISRSAGVDVITREGLDDALAGVDAIVDAATGPSPEQGEATAFFTTAARNLQEAG